MLGLLKTLGILTVEVFSLVVIIHYKRLCLILLILLIFCQIHPVSQLVEGPVEGRDEEYEYLRTHAEEQAEDMTEDESGPVMGM